MKRNESGLSKRQVESGWIGNETVYFVSWNTANHEELSFRGQETPCIWSDESSKDHIDVIIAATLIF